MASLSELTNKLAAGTRLSDDDARQLAATTDLVTVGMLAAEARRVHAGEGVTYVRVAEIACDAALPEGGWPDAAREIRIIGTPASTEQAIACVRAVVASAGARGGANGGNCPVTGFSLVDLWQLAGGTADGLKAFASGLAEAGLVAIADVPVDRFVGTQAAEALGAILAAGLTAPVARWDVAPADPVAALKIVRELQAKTTAFRAFAPLPRHSSSSSSASASASSSSSAQGSASSSASTSSASTSSGAPPSSASAAGAGADTSSQSSASASSAASGAQAGAASAAPQTGYDGVKLVALARVMLDNVPFIQVDWSRHGPKLAQVALLFGASDLDRVSPSDASPLGHRRAPLEEVQRNIAAAFLQPLERDGRFVRVSR
jgi:hypothetical protein